MCRAATIPTGIPFDCYSCVLPSDIPTSRPPPSRDLFVPQACGDLPAVERDVPRHDYPHRYPGRLHTRVYSSSTSPPPAPPRVISLFLRRVAIFRRSSAMCRAATTPSGIQINAYSPPTSPPHAPPRVISLFLRRVAIFRRSSAMCRAATAPRGPASL